jgi:pumilio RNA-binding family
MIKNDLKEICSNFISNSLMKTLLDILTYENIDLFLLFTKQNLYDICLTEPGSRIFQKLIEKIYNSPLQLKTFILNLQSKDIGILIKSAYGNHLLHKLLLLLNTNKEYTKLIFNYIIQHFIDIALDKHGVCFLQKCLLVLDDEQRKAFYNKTAFYIKNIMKDCYGNFLIHYILSKCQKIKLIEISEIILKIEENIVDFCKYKYSSSVIEKCFEQGNEEISEHIINNLLEYHSNSIVNILMNPFGFYVIKKSMKINNNKLKDKISYIIINNLDKIKDGYFTNKIITNFISEYNGFSDILYEKNK